MNKKVIEQLAGALKFDVEELTKVLTSEEEVDFKLPETIKIFTNDEFEQIKDNHGKNKYDEGKLASSEMQLKDMSKKVGFEDPIKDADEFIKAYKKSILDEASIEPNKKVEELQTSLEKLQGLVSEKDKAITDLENTFKQKETRITAQSLIPDLPKNIGLSKSEATSLFFLNHQIKDDGIYKNGEKLKDDVEKPLDLATAVSKYVSEKGWDKSPEPIGRGGGSQSQGSNGKPESLKEFEEYISQKGLNVGSAEANALLKEMATENPEILN
tara:strand:+ start:4868 stop:5677 length:810 start_codon:yes stop_codon:yes gene_type:complete